MQRDLVVLGASAGGVSALIRVVEAFPGDFDAAVVAAMHLSDSDGTHHLASLIQRRTTLTVRWAEQGDRIDRGCIYIAPPGVHTEVVDDHLQLLATARENYVRPSLDRLFSSMARLHGPRVIGVLMTGMMTDGVAGMIAIQTAGGFTIVEDPDTAAVRELPAHALAQFSPDLVLPIERIGDAIVREVNRVQLEARP